MCKRPVSVTFSREAETKNRRHLYREICFKASVRAVAGTSDSEICRAGQQAGSLGRNSVL